MRGSADLGIRFMKKHGQLTTPILLRLGFILTVLMTLSLTCVQLQAQQNPYPFNLDLSLGGGLIGNPDVSTGFQPEVGFSYMPGKFGIGLNAGLLSYDPTFDARQYASGFEEYTSVSGSDEKWSSFFIGVGPRYEFGSRLPVTFRSSLDLSLSYNEPPSVSVDFNDPTGSSGDTQLQLSGYEAVDDYSKWSAAIRPEIQMQFSPGGSQRFAIQLTTGIQHRLSKNEFSYTQKDLSEVRLVPNAEEMFAQFDAAPAVQQTANPPQTNFFTTVGIKIKFGRVKHLHDEGVIHRDIASRSAPDGSGTGDCDDSDADRCLKPGEMAFNDPDSDGDGLGDGMDTEYLREANMMARLGNHPNVVSVGQVSTVMTANGNPLHTAKGNGENVLYEGEANDGNGDNETNNNTPSTALKYDIQPRSYCMELSTMQISTNAQKGMRGTGGNRASSATDYNSSRSNTTSSIDMSGDDTGNGDVNSDSTRISNAMDYNSSRSNTTSSVSNPNDGGDGDLDNDSTGVSMATSHNASRSNRSQGISNEGGDPGSGTDSTRIASATDYNSSRSNTTSSIADLGGDLDGDGFPDFMEDASLSVTKRKRPGRAKYGNITLDKSMNNGGDLDADGLDDTSGVNIELEIGDPDSDGDGLMDAIESATYSISKRSARTGRSTTTDNIEPETTEWDGTTEERMASDDDPCGPGVWARTTGGNANCTPENSDQENPLAKESDWQETPVSEVTPQGNVHQWTYKLSALSGGNDLPGNGTLTVIMTGGKVHFNVHFDPDSDEDGYGDLLQNSTFSISKRSARTGRNPQASQE